MYQVNKPFRSPRLSFRRKVTYSCIGLIIGTATGLSVAVANAQPLTMQQVQAAVDNGGLRIESQSGLSFCSQ